MRQTSADVFCLPKKAEPSFTENEERSAIAEVNAEVTRVFKLFGQRLAVRKVSTLCSDNKVI